MISLPALLEPSTTASAHRRRHTQLNPGVEPNPPSSRPSGATQRFSPISMHYDAMLMPRLASVLRPSPRVIHALVATSLLDSSADDQSRSTPVSGRYNGSKWGLTPGITCGLRIHNAMDACAARFSPPVRSVPEHPVLLWTDLTTFRAMIPTPTWLVLSRSMSGLACKMTCHVLPTTSSCSIF